MKHDNEMVMQAYMRYCAYEVEKEWLSNNVTHMWLETGEDELRPFAKVHAMAEAYRVAEERYVTDPFGSESSPEYRAAWVTSLVAGGTADASRVERYVCDILYDAHILDAQILNTPGVEDTSEERKKFKGEFWNKHNSIREQMLLEAKNGKTEWDFSIFAN